MARYKSSTWKAVIRHQNIEAYYRHKAAAELLPENEHVFRPKIQADARVILWFRDKPQIQFSLYRLPWGWSISPTLAGKKVQQVLMRA